VFAPVCTNLMAAFVIVQIAAGTGRFWPRLLSLGFLRTAGKYSYALYLFHAPLLHPLIFLLPASQLVAFFGSELAGNLTFVVFFMAVNFALALLSWHAFEKHWLKLKDRFEARRGPAPGTTA